MVESKKKQDRLLKLRQAKWGSSSTKSLSSGMAWPSDNDLAMMRIGGRSINDVSSMELYMFSSISSNPYETIEAFKRALVSYTKWGAIFPQCCKKCIFLNKLCLKFLDCFFFHFVATHNGSSFLLWQKKCTFFILSSSFLTSNF